MDVRNANVEPTIEHGGTCRSYFMFPKASFRAETEGSWLEFVGEFELEPGAALAPHRHDSHEFYYLLSGEAVMQVEDEERTLRPGDLVHIPRNAVHSIRPAGDGTFRALAFACSFEPEGATYVDAELPPVAAR
jgi:mannose-6-phosphate isomerase-like protein (cupin superfamily)